MKRRSFVKNMSLAAVSSPFVLNGMNFQTVSKELFKVSKSVGDRVLVLIRLNGGNDGLNMVVPIDQYANLTIQRNNIILPQNSILQLTPSVGLHPVMTGMRDMYNNGKLSILQNVGYPEQNRSHFRSMDIWTSGSMDQHETRGWLGRYMDDQYPNYPEDYPNSSYPDPFAISMGYEVSATCQGLMANFSQALEDPFSAVNLATSSVVNDGSYYGSHMEYLATLIDQTNAYGSQINDAANAGSTLSTMYDANNPVAVQLRYVAQMISGGLETKVYILNINGFDTHASQVLTTDTTTGEHADLLKTLSDAVAAFQNDLQLLGIEHRVAGITFSEFGRQVASNASNGTDHGDAAPMFLFGSCISSQIVGPNPVISNQVVDQQGVPMQIDFRDVYASLLMDWFQVSLSEVQPLFEQQINYIPLLTGCTLEVNELEKDIAALMVYPNPAVSNTTVRFNANNEWVKVTLIDQSGRVVAVVFDGKLEQGTHNIPIELTNVTPGNYLVSVRRTNGEKSVRLVKLK